jgi:hypothetical protein
MLRFWFKSDVAGKTFYAALRNGAPDRTYLTTFTVATTGWERIAITVPGDTTGTWATDTGRGLHFTITVACGTDLHGVAGWQAGNKLALAGANSNGGTTLSLFLADVGLYLDPLNTGIAPPWQMPDEAEELRACQRYWQIYTGLGSGGYSAAGVGNFFTTSLACVMRTAPAVAFSSSAVTNCAAMTLSGSYPHQIRPYTVVTATGGYSCSATVSLSARM